MLFSGGDGEVLFSWVTEKCCFPGLRRSVVLRGYGEVLYSENREKCCFPGGRRRLKGKIYILVNIVLISRMFEHDYYKHFSGFHLYNKTYKTYMCSL